jgi:hypothetical protein
MITVAASGADADLITSDVFANFDLDGDRGYFYKTWEGKIESDIVRSVRYI